MQTSVVLLSESPVSHHNAIHYIIKCDFYCYILYRQQDWPVHKSNCQNAEAVDESISDSDRFNMDDPEFVLSKKVRLDIENLSEISALCRLISKQVLSAVRLYQSTGQFLK